MTNYSIAGSSGTTGLSHLTDPLAPGDKMPVVNVSDFTTDPHGSAGSDQYMTVADLAGTVAQVLYPSADTSGATDAAAIVAAIAALPGGAGLIRLAPTADWNIECGQVTAATAVYIDATGCWISARGAGDVFRFVDSSTYLSRGIQGGGILGFPVIDGTHVTGNSSAVHAGDILQLTMDVQVQNFTGGTTSKGCWFDNQNYWAEQMRGRIFASNCTAHVVFDVSGTPATTATGSYDRADLSIYVIPGSSAQDAVVFQSGTVIVDGALRIAGNFTGAGSAPSSAVLRLTGTASGSRPDTGVSSNLTSCRLEIGVECDDSGPDIGPQTITFGSSSNFIFACYGVMDFAAAGLIFQVSNGTSANFDFFGRINGDDTLRHIPQFIKNPVTITLPLVVEDAIFSNSNTLDDGVTGASFFAGVMTQAAGTDTSSTATASSPTFVSGTALQLNTTQDTMLYISVATATRTGIAIGSTSSVTSVILAEPTTAQVAGAMYTVRVPKGWFVKITSSNAIADLTITAVTC